MKTLTTGNLAIRGIVAIVLLIVVYFAYYFISYVYAMNAWPQLEKEAKQEILTQVAHHPGVKIVDILTWEGDTSTTIEINENTRASFWYRKGGPPRIGHIGIKNGKSYSTEFDCENKDYSGNRIYSYNSLLEITKEYPVGNLFDFEVRSVDDLIQNIDRIISKIDTFPRQTKTVTVIDRSGTRQMTKNPDPKYAFKFSLHSFGINWLIYSLVTHSMSTPTGFVA